MELTNEQWNRIEPIILTAKPCKDPRGRKARDPREVLNGILLILRTGAPSKDLPQRYPPYQTCHRRFQQWVRSGTFKRIAHELAQDLYERGGIDIREAFIDGTFVPAEKGGGLLSGRQCAAKAPRSMAIANTGGVRVAAHIESALHHEVRLVDEATTDSGFTEFSPDRLVGDKDYDIDSLDDRLFSWLQNFRRLVVRYEYHAENFLGLVQLGCSILLLRLF